MNSILSKLLIPPNMAYLTIDAELIIQDTSLDVQRFAESPDKLMVGEDIRLSFPELIGVEDSLIAVSEGRQDSFELKGIGRGLDNNQTIYFNLYAIEKPEQNLLSKLVILFEDVTEKLILEQTLIQASNETSLLLSTISASKDYIDKIIAFIADALIVTTKAGKIKRVNQAAENVFGYAEQELINQPISKIIEDGDFLIQVIQQYPLSAGESLKDVEVVCQTKSGKKVTVEFSCSVIQTDIDNLQDYIYLGRDVTARQRDQKRLVAQYATARALSESATIKQAIPKILLAICESLGWALGELWMPEEDERGEATGGTQNSAQNQKSLRCVESWSRPSVAMQEFSAIARETSLALGVGLAGRVWQSGSPYWISDVTNDRNFGHRAIAAKAGLHAAFGFPIQSDNEVLGVITFYSREVQHNDNELLQMMSAVGSQVGQFIKRKRAEAALAESEERYRDLFENASDLIQSVAADGHFLYVNRAWKETLGYSESEVTTMNMLDIIHPDCRTDCMAIFHRAMLGEKIDRVKAEFITKDRQKICVEGSVNCKFIDGQPIATRAMFRDITQRLAAEEALRHQQEQTERLLLNILPLPIADRLKQNETTIADDFASVTVMFADLVGFTSLSARTSPTEMVEILNVIFSEFDQLAEQHGLEKIKTIGDAYMVVGGLPMPMENHPAAIAEMALDMQDIMAQFREETGKSLNIRIGINTGPVVAGVIGMKKFIYDLWGDTVNVASRMESHGLPNRIQVTTATYEHLQNQYLFEERGAIQVKGKGKMTTYLLIGRIPN
ncbi:PAS domain S-box protein [Microcoleus sp. FACHB-831]|uniref:adenylate/guanylate cyclase domain-containing protein n=1 Tax=Microcoleus sp. FACHB-831 TaxID=2692827 RepID=UPI001688CF98|nr:adenylate/guanylate cyclase domain-containing protein [Microcoleus sp. FACHB-831]MBD1919627.1 PAS domain S-box protein [Microcoleus sp. FACHB-831]